MMTRRDHALTGVAVITLISAMPAYGQDLQGLQGLQALEVSLFEMIDLLTSIFPFVAIMWVAFFVFGSTARSKSNPDRPTRKATKDGLPKVERVETEVEKSRREVAVKVGAVTKSLGEAVTTLKMRNGRCEEVQCLVKVHGTYRSIKDLVMSVDEDGCRKIRRFLAKYGEITRSLADNVATVGDGTLDPCDLRQLVRAVDTIDALARRVGDEIHGIQKQAVQVDLDVLDALFSEQGISVPKQ